MPRWFSSSAAACVDRCLVAAMAGRTASARSAVARCLAWRLAPFPAPAGRLRLPVATRGSSPEAGGRERHLTRAASYGVHGLARTMQLPLT
jgi:hypothetical protein